MYYVIKELPNCFVNVPIISKLWPNASREFLLEMGKLKISRTPKHKNHRDIGRGTLLASQLALFFQSDDCQRYIKKKHKICVFFKGILSSRSGKVFFSNNMIFFPFKKVLFQVDHSNHISRYVYFKILLMFSVFCDTMIFINIVWIIVWILLTNTFVSSINSFIKK